MEQYFFGDQHSSMPPPTRGRRGCPVYEAPSRSKWSREAHHYDRGEGKNGEQIDNCYGTAG
eukprot:1957606-Ditylum_brightwellii.AAC.1